MKAVSRSFVNGYRLVWVVAVLGFFAACSTGGRSGALADEDAVRTPASPDAVTRANLFGGAPSPVGRFSYVAAILSDDGNFCSGFLVHPLWVMSAAHCFVDRGGRVQAPGSLTIGIGENRTAASAVVGAAEVRVHPNYFPSLEREGGFDVALVKLALPVTNVTPPGLPDGRVATAPGSFADAVGFGITENGGAVPEIANTKGLAVLSDERCRAEEAFPRININRSLDSILCAEATPTDTASDTCPGDSGGPLVGRDAAGSDLVVGVHSFLYADGCVENFQAANPIPSFYLDLADRRVGSWVYETLDEKFLSYDKFLRFANLPVPTDAIGGISLARLFDESYYLRTNPDVAQAVATGLFASGYAHFVQDGLSQGRNPSILYNERYYLGRNGDVAAAVAAGVFRSGLEHYLLTGHREGRPASAYFNEAEYLAANGDLPGAIASGVILSGFQHFVRSGQDELRTPELALFNEASYLSRNGDVAGAVAAGVFADGLAHFVVSGQFESRDVSAGFSTPAYLNANGNGDLRSAFASGAIVSAFDHYRRAGRFEFRRVR